MHIPFSRGAAAVAISASLVALAAPAHAVDLVGLTVTNGLVRVSSDAPGFASPTVGITGLGAGERVLAIDTRPSTGLLYGLTDASKLYTLDISTGAASFVTSLSTLLAGPSIGLDFNPVPDLGQTANSLRVMTSAGQNLRVQVNAAGATPQGNAIVDGALNGATTRLDAVAYTNNDRDPATATALFGIDSASNALYSVVANAGTTSFIGNLGFDVTAVAGFEIAGANSAFAALTIGGDGDAKTSLYSIDLATGAATSLGAFGFGGFNATAPQLQGLAVSPVPEPETYALMLAGLLAVGTIARRKAKRAERV